MSRSGTGPRSDEGKQRSSLNALKHGLRSERPVLPGEDPAEWDAFRQGVVADLQPVGVLECELADRVALQLWRLRRAARYEAEVAAAQCAAARLAAAADPLHRLRPELDGERLLAEAFAHLARLKDDLLAAEAVRRLTHQLPTLPEEELLAPREAAGLLTLLTGHTWAPLDAPDTAGQLRAELAEALNLSESEALAVAGRRAEESSRLLADIIADWARRIGHITQGLAQQGEAMQHDSRLLHTAALERVVRYEAHVGRQLNQALNLLRQFQAQRRAREEEAREAPAAPPAASEPGPAAAAPTRTPAAVARSSFGNPDTEAVSAVPTADSRNRPDGVPAADTGQGEFVRQAAVAHRNGFVAGVSPPETS